MTRAAAGLAALDLLIAILGYALLYALGQARLRARDVRLLGLAYLAGWALLGTALSLLLIVGVPVGGVATVLTVAALSAGLVLVGRRTAPLDAPERPRARGPVAVVVVVVAAGILVVEGIAALLLSLRYDWDPFLDSLTAWLPRASIVHYTHSLDPSAWQSFVTPWYPPLFPAMHGVAFDFAGGVHPSLLAFQQSLLGLAFVAAAGAVASRYAPAWLTLPVLAALLSTPWFWWRLRAIVPDQTLAYLLGVAALACMLWLHERRRSWLWLAVVLLAAAALTKLEGVLFGGLLALTVVAVSAVTDRRTARSAALLFLGPAAIAPWYAWLKLHAVASSTADYNAPKLVSPSYLAQHVDRLRLAFRFLVNGPFRGPEGFEPRTAALTCLAVVVVAVVAIRIPALAVAAASWLALSFVGLLLIYWTSRVDIAFYVVTSASRVGTSLIIDAAALIPLLLGIALRAGASRSERTSSQSSATSSTSRSGTSHDASGSNPLTSAQ